MKIYFNIVLVIVLLFAAVIKTHALIQPAVLRVESMVNPVGIEAANPSLSWQWNSDKRSSFQVAYQVIVASSSEKIRKNQADVWNSGVVKSDQQLYIKFNGKKLESGKTYYWKVKIWDNHNQVSAWSKPAVFTMGLLNPADWNAKWITYRTDAIKTQPLFRKSFRLKKNIKNALAHISGLGYYELYLNGKKTGDHVLDPGQTNYEDYALYVTYDITKQLKGGDNVVGVMLGDGWYNQNRVWGVNGKGFVYGNPILICQLTIEYTDGTKEQILTDGTWKWMNGPVVRSNVYAGEEYDARKEIEEWSSKELEGAGWMPVELVKDFPPKLIAQTLPPIKKMKELPAKKVYKTAEGTYIFDFGQNFAGFTRLQISAPAGTEISIRTAEKVDADGKLNTASTGVFATKVEQIDKYTCKGKGVEIWEPRFTYHGFRYAEVKGLTREPDRSLLTGIVLYSSVNEAGSFECSDEQFNRLHQMACWTLISNLHSVPTDCPAREKCGWLGDVQAEALMSIYNYDMEMFYIKYLYDIRSTSRNEAPSFEYRTWNKHERKVKPKGIPYMIAPGKRITGTASPDWGTVVVQLPWYLYQYYGNKDVLREFYPDMKTWVHYVNGLSQNGIVSYGLGDWCPPGSVVPLTPPMPFTSTAFHYLDLGIMEQVSSLLGFKEDAAWFEDKKMVAKNAVLDSFYNKKELTFGGQTANAMAIELDLAPQTDKRQLSDNIVKMSRDSLDGFLNTGVFGLSRIFNALSEHGNEAAAYSILTKKGYKSFDYMWSEHDATTLWEILPVDSFYLKETDKGWERSLNHPMQGGFDKWFYESVLGIRPIQNKPGFKGVYVEPGMLGSLQWAKGFYNTGYGKIVSDWRLQDRTLVWKVEVPVNTLATICFPTANINNVTEGGSLITGLKDIKIIEEKNGKVTCEVGSGTYSFKVSGIRI